MLGRKVGKKKRKKSIREKGGETFTTYGPFFFLRELSFRGRGRNKTPAIHTTYLVFIPFLQVQRPPSAFRPAAPITFSSHSPALYDFPAGLHFTLTHPSFVPSLFLSRRISIQAPPPILQRIPFSQIIPKTR